MHLIQHWLFLQKIKLQLEHDKLKVLTNCTECLKLSAYHCVITPVLCFVQEGEGSGKRKAEDDEEIATKKAKKYVISDEEEEEEEDDE